MGFFSQLDSEQYDRKYSDQQLLQRMGDYLHPHAKQLAAVVALILTIALLGALQPWIVSSSVDILSDVNQRSTAAWLIAAVLFTGVSAWLVNWLRRKYTIRIIGDVVLSVRTDAFRAAAGHDLSFYDQNASGRIVSRITSDTQEFAQLVLLVTDVLSQIIEALILAVILVSIEWRLSLILFAFLPVIFLGALGFRHMARTVTRKGMRAMANVNSVIKETISGIAVAKNFRQEAAVFSTFDQANRQSYHVNLQRGMVLAMVFPALNMIGGISTAVLVYSGGLTVTQGAVTIGAWYLFLLSLDRFFFPILNLSSFWAQIQSGLSAAERSFALIDAEPAVIQSVDTISTDLKGEISFEHVDFYYKPGEPVLSDFNLHIQPGENIALVGHTGAGKSSIAKLIARFYEFQGGRISIDGYDLRTFNLESFRRQLGIISQNPFLFSGTVFDNICYALRSGVDPCEVERLAYQIGNGEWVESLPNGLQTQVGERGARLSLGQRQLVALLRVLVQKPAIFILDEATASIDPFTEAQIQQAIELLLKASTSIMIAHRLSTVRAADRIIVMDHGRIIEEGSHTGLMAANGHYAHLYQTYFRHQSLSYIEQRSWANTFPVS